MAPRDHLALGSMDSLKGVDTMKRTLLASVILSAVITIIAPTANASYDIGSGGNFLTECLTNCNNMVNPGDGRQLCAGCCQNALNWWKNNQSAPMPSTTDCTKN